MYKHLGILMKKGFDLWMFEHLTQCLVIVMSFLC